jgi:general secretion pathway protein L
MQIVLPPGWPDATTALSWFRVGRDGRVEQGQCADVTQLPDAARAGPVHVWTPSGETLLTTVSLPTRSRAQILKALPYALEDQLLDDPDRQQFAYCHEATGQLAVAVTARERIRTWVDTLRAAGIKPASAAPTVLGLPHVNASWTIGFEGEEMLVRTGLHSGFACPLAHLLPPDILTAALREADHAPQGLLVFGAPSGFARAKWKELLEIAVEQHDEGWRAAGGGAPPALNLLQGDFVAAGQYKTSIGPYRPAAVMLVLLALGAFGVDAVEWWQLRQTHQKYQEQMATLLRETFPEIKGVLDPARQMQKQLDALLANQGAAGAGDMMPLLDRAAPAIVMNPQVRLRTLQYGDKALTVDVTLPNAPALESLRSAMQGAYLQSEVLTSEQRGPALESRLRVRALASEPGKGGKG